MEIVLTGSLGHISKPLATALIAKGHGVTVVTRSNGRIPEIGKLGAKAAVGSVEDGRFAFIPMIQSAGFIGSVYGGDDRLAMVAPADIAAAVAEELEKTDGADRVRYVCSDDRPCREVAAVLGRSIGMPDLQWRVLPREPVLAALISNGVPENFALNLVELGEATHAGILRKHFEQVSPTFGTVKLESFAAEFAQMFNTKNK